MTSLFSHLKKSFTVISKKKGVLEAISFLTALLIWECVAVFIVRNEFFLPRFSSVAISFSELLSGEILVGDILTSLFHLGVGLIVAICVAIPLGAIMGWFRIAHRIAYPLIEILRPIPPLAWIPFALAWLHLTHYAAGFVVFIGAFFPILINTYTGFKNVPKIYVESAKVLGCIKDRDMMRAVAFPSALPFITTGIRIGTGVGWMSVVAAEIFGVSTSGLGYRIWAKFIQFHEMDKLVIYMIILGLLALLIDRVFRFFAEDKLLKWHKEIVA